MRKILNILLLFPILAIAQSPDQNWVKTKTYKQPITTAVETPTPAQAVTQVSYFDGLGRAIQQVAHAQSNTGKDIVTHIVYDAYGRVEKEFLPYANQNSSLYYNASAGTEVLGFYNTTGYENTSNPYSQKQFEASPLNRVLKQAAPGDAWSMGSGKEIKFDYQTNTATDVKLYKVTTTWNATLGVYDIALLQTGHFAANQLYKTITYDENSPGGTSNVGRTEEYKDKEGKVVLKRTFNNSIAHETHYVYDTFGNLTYVIPPLVTSATTQLAGLCYQYKYDARNRLVEKKLPGKQWEYIVYDKLDRVVATGPAYNPWGGGDSNKGWLLTKYDVFNRPVYTAWYNGVSVNTSTDRKKLQTSVDSNTIFSESKSTATVTIDAVATKYTNTVFPTFFKLLTVNYFDSYDFPNASPIPAQIEGQNTQSTNLKGMPTGSWVRVLDAAGSTSNELSYTVYDTKYRPIRSYTKNYLGGYTQVDSKLDWAGKTLYTVTSQKRTTSGQLFTVKERFTYTEQDRLLKHTHEIVGALPEQLLTLNTYDELGQLTSKNVGGTDVTGAQALQSVDYSYNIRGWLNAINDVTNLDTDLFAFKINYNQKENGTEGLFNGNITETLWRTNADNIKRKYAYTYDDLNRLLQANYSKPDAGTNQNNYKEWLNYDPNGNITDIVRTGFMDPVAGTVENLIDDLKFVYDTNSQNRLLKVNDISTSPQGFKDGTNTNNDFSYDNNGNMTADNNKGIGSIIYNHLNLPIKINFGAKGEITYLYNAAGQKVQKFAKDVVSNTNTTTDYLSGFQYLNTTLQFFPHAEGYVHYTKPLAAQGGENSELGSFNYVFNYTDHLGNVRVSFAKDPLQGNVLKILEENHYYPFGMKHENYNVTRLNFKFYPETGVDLVPLPAVANASYNVKYNGKELQEELGLNMTAMDFRQYDSAIGRFVGMDRLSELAPGINPYRFAYNNPISYSDPSGLFETRFGAWWHRLWNADGGGKIQFDKKNDEYYYLTTHLDPNGNKGENGVDLITKKEYGHGSGNLLGGLIQNGNVDANGNTPLDNYRQWQNNTGYNPGETKGDRIARLMGAFSYEARRDFASGGMNMYGGMGGALRGVNNSVPTTLARVVPAHIESTTLGARGAAEVFVTAASDIQGLSAAQIAQKLTIPPSSTGFKIINFSTPQFGIATPYVNQSPGFVGFGRTAGGAREFIIPNQSIPQSAKIIIIK